MEEEVSADLSPLVERIEQALEGTTQFAWDEWNEEATTEKGGLVASALYTTGGICILEAGNWHYEDGPEAVIVIANPKDAALIATAPELLGECLARLRAQDEEIERLKASAREAFDCIDLLYEPTGQEYKGEPMRRLPNEVKLVERAGPIGVAQRTLHAALSQTQEEASG